MPSVRAWIIFGVALRAALLLLSAPLELQSDEAQYAWLGLSWERFGFLSDSQRFLWPPAYPFLHKLAFQLFHEDGVMAVRALQVSCSIATGWATAALAQRFVGERAAPIAAALWALHLPLAGYSALGWPDALFLALFLPALLLLHDAVRDSDQRRLILAGLLFGLTALFKELGLAMALLATTWLTVKLYRDPLRTSIPTLLTFALAVALPLAPWAARNLQHYGSPILSGKTLGENVYQGWNAHDHNFDVLPVVRSSEVNPRPDTNSAAFTQVDAGETWERPGGATLLERNHAKLTGGLRWARDNPGDLLRTRVSKAAHMFAPVSFPVRHLALGHFGGHLGRGIAGRTFLVFATVQSILLIVFGAASLMRRTPTHALFWIPTVALLCQPLLVGMSRLRVPLTPFLIIAIAGALINARTFRSRLPETIAGATACALILVDIRPTLWLLRYAWGLEI